MSAEKKYTERQLVLAKREAFFRGYENAVQGWGLFHSFTPSSNNLAEHEYPLPKIERPRVVHEPMVDTMREFRYVGGAFQARTAVSLSGYVPGSGWEPIDGGWKISPAVVRLFADLLAHPTELVDDDGAEDSV